MKSFALRIVAIALLVFVSSFSACEQIADATSVDVPINVNLAFNASPATFPSVDNECVDLTSNKDFNDNKDKIDGGELSSIAFQITELSGADFNPETAIISNVRFVLRFDPSYGDNTEYEVGTFSNIKIKDLLSQSYNVNVTPIINTVIGEIPDRPKFCVYATYGALNGAPISNAASLRCSLSLQFRFKVPTI
jgi:hypothetical protein